MLTVKAQKPTLPGIFIKELDDFINVIHEYSVEVIFTNKEKGSIPRTPNREYFFFPKEGVVIHAPTNNYENIQDYIDSKKLGLSDPNEYTKFTESGANSREEYDELLLNSFSTIDEREHYRSLNLEKLYSRIPDFLKIDSVHDKLQNLLRGIRSPKDLLVFARNYGSQFLESFLISGFSDYEQWQYGKEHGFTNEEELITARNEGFINYNDYSLAEKVGIHNSEIFKVYNNDFEISNGSNYKCFEFSLLTELQEFPNRFSKLLKTIKDLSLNRYKDTYIFSDLFQKIDSFYELAIQLKTEPIYSKLTPTIINGFVNPNSTTLLTKVAIDASNVCWYEKNKNTDNLLRAKNLLELEQIVKEYGVQEIIFIADANLRYEIDNPKILDQLENENRLYYSHKEPADKHLLSLSKNRGYIIVSNDKFRDWKEFGDDGVMRIGFSKDSNFGFDLE